MMDITKIENVIRICNSSNLLENFANGNYSSKIPIVYITTVTFKLPKRQKRATNYCKYRMEELFFLLIAWYLKEVFITSIVSDPRRIHFEIIVKA
jgi:hypothetical protein